MPEMFDEHPGHLVLTHCRFLIADCRLFALVCSSLASHQLVNARLSIGNAFHYFVGEGFAGAPFDGDGFAEADGEGFAEADADGDGDAIGGVTGVP